MDRNTHEHRAVIASRPPTDFSTNSPKKSPQSCQPLAILTLMSCLQYEMTDLLESSIPPDPELVDLIEWAFLEGQIDGQRADLAYLWLQAKRKIIKE